MTLDELEPPKRTLVENKIVFLNPPEKFQ